MQLFFAILAAFCPSRGKSAANGTGAGTPFMDAVGVLTTSINEHLPDNTKCIINGRAVCKKKPNSCHCLDLDDHELRAAATELRTIRTL
jgi:hypothetical protein